MKVKCNQCFGTGYVQTSFGPRPCPVCGGNGVIYFPDENYVDEFDNDEANELVENYSNENEEDYDDEHEDYSEVSENSINDDSFEPYKERKKFSGSKVFAWLLFILLFILAGLYVGNYYLKKEAARKAEDTFYKWAIESHTQKAYNEYLQRYPNSIHSYDIREKLNKLQEQQRIEEERRLEEERKKKRMLERMLDNLLKYKMVFVKGGTFTMGCTSEQNICDDDEKPAHSVTVDDYYIGKYEITQKQWRKIMSNNPSYFSGCDSCPVENVSWNNVQSFITRLNQKYGMHYRLPTEAEWEYAARGGNQSRGYQYSGSNNIEDVAWYNGNSGNKTHPVGEKVSNELRIYDMSGNVWEWCSDWYGEDYYKNSPPNNPKGPSSGRYHLIRGGSFMNDKNGARVSDRVSGSPTYHYRHIGLRLVYPLKNNKSFMDKHNLKIDSL